MVHFCFYDRFNPSFSESLGKWVRGDINQAVQTTVILFFGKWALCMEGWREYIVLPWNPSHFTKYESPAITILNCFYSAKLYQNSIFMEMSHISKCPFRSWPIHFITSICTVCKAFWCVWKAALLHNQSQGIFLLHTSTSKTFPACS